MIYRRVVPEGWVEVPGDHVAVYERIGAPVAGVGLGHFVPRWAYRLAHEWPSTLTDGAITAPTFRDPALLGRVVRALWRDLLGDPNDAVAAVLAAQQLGGADAVLELLGYPTT